VAHGLKKALNVLKCLQIKVALKNLKNLVRVTEVTSHKLSLKLSKMRCLASRDQKKPGSEEMILTSIKSGFGTTEGTSIRTNIETGGKTDQHQRKKRIA